jgi:predicted metal-dependent phosphoesterase TrpH
MLVELDDEIDILEVWNGRTIVQSHNRKAAEWARTHKLPAAASSDAHGWIGWGGVYTTIALAPEPHTLCSLLRNASLTTAQPGVRMLLYPKVNRVSKWSKRLVRKVVS